MIVVHVLAAIALVAVVVAGLWVDYQCNWKKQESRGFEVLPPGASPAGPRATRDALPDPRDGGSGG